MGSSQNIRNQNLAPLFKKWNLCIFINLFCLVGRHYYSMQNYLPNSFLSWVCKDESIRNYNIKPCCQILWEHICFEVLLLDTPMYCTLVLHFHSYITVLLPKDWASKETSYYVYSLKIFPFDTYSWSFVTNLEEFLCLTKGISFQREAYLKTTGTWYFWIKSLTVLINIIQQEDYKLIHEQMKTNMTSSRYFCTHQSNPMKFKWRDSRGKHILWRKHCVKKTRQLLPDGSFKEQTNEKLGSISL